MMGTTASLKQGLLSWRNRVIWLYGLSGAGKSTIAHRLQQQMHKQRITTVLLDGDELRLGVNKDLGFSEADRRENVRRVAEMAKLLVAQDQTVICSLITPLHTHRQLAKQILEDSYFGVLVNCPLSICEQRDVKGLYQKARQKQITSFTGISSPFETFADDDLVVYTATQTVEESVAVIWEQLQSFVVDIPGTLRVRENLNV